MTTMDIDSWVSVTSVLVAGVISLLVYWTWKSVQVFKTFERLGIPGPTPSLLTGNSHEMTEKGMCNSCVEWRKKYGKCFGVYLPREPVLVISDLDLLCEVMVKKFASFPNRATPAWRMHKPWSHVLLNLKDDHWKHVRSQLSPTFSSGKLKKMMPAIDQVLHNLFRYIKDKAETGEELELKYVAGCFAMDTIAGAAFGMEVNSLFNPEDPFRVNGLKFFGQSSWILPFLLKFPVMADVLRWFGISPMSSSATNYFIDLMDAALTEGRRDKKGQSDFLQLLMDAEREGNDQGPVDAEIDHSAHLTTSGQWTRKGLNEDEMKANALIFFLAGYDTTSIALSFTLFQLAANPEALKKAQEEVDKKVGKNPVCYETANELTYIDMCMNEAVRLNPPLFLIDRQSVDDVEFAGYQLKKETTIMIPVYAIHRDPEIWPEPEKYIPERHTPEAKAARHPFAFLPFGHGPRNCIGMRLAQLEIRMAIATLLQHFTPVLCDKSVYPPELETPHFRMVAKDGLWVKFKARE